MTLEDYLKKIARYKLDREHNCSFVSKNIYSESKNEWVERENDIRKLSKKDRRVQA